MNISAAHAEEHREQLKHHEADQHSSALTLLKADWGIMQLKQARGELNDFYEQRRADGCVAELRSAIDTISDRFRNESSEESRSAASGGTGLHAGAIPTCLFGQQPMFQAWVRCTAVANLANRLCFRFPRLQ